MTTATRTRADLEAEIVAKRKAQREAVIPSTAAELGVELDVLIAEWDAAR
jgi:hypothetical protein